MTGLLDWLNQQGQAVGGLLGPERQAVGGLLSAFQGLSQGPSYLDQARQFAGMDRANPARRQLMMDLAVNSPFMGALTTPTKGTILGAIGNTMAKAPPKQLTAQVVENFLNKNGAKYTVEASKSLSDRHGPSASSYFHVETPNGVRTIRLSDHDYVQPSNGIDLRLGQSVEYNLPALYKFLGQDVPPAVDAAMKQTPEWQSNSQKMADFQNMTARIDADIAAREANARILAEHGKDHLTGDARKRALKAIKKQLSEK